MTNDRQARAARAEAMRKEREKADKRQRNLITVAIVAIVVVLIGAAGWGVKSLSDANTKQSDLVAPQNLVDGGFEFTGATAAQEDAPVVEVFEDFLCPHCGEFEAGPASAFLKQKADAGEIVLRFHPMTIMDGVADDGPAHDVMNAAVCAASEQGGEAFWDVHSALFGAQLYSTNQAPSSSDLIALTEGAGVSGLEACIRSGQYVPWLSQAREDGADKGVTGTPSVIVDGTKIEDVSQAGLEAAIADA